MKTPRLPSLLLCCLAGCIATGAAAQEGPLEVTAERGELNDRERIATYHGQVVVTQGAVQLSGDRLRIYYDQHHKPQRLLLEGTPARYRGRPRPAGEKHAGQYDEAQAQRMEYLVESGLLVLEREARVQQPEFTLASDRIEYETRRGTVRASGEEGMHWSIPEVPEDLEDLVR